MLSSRLVRSLMLSCVSFLCSSFRVGSIPWEISFLFHLDRLSRRVQFTRVGYAYMRHHHPPPPSLSPLSSLKTSTPYKRLLAWSQTIIISTVFSVFFVYLCVFPSFDLHFAYMPLDLCMWRLVYLYTLSCYKNLPISMCHARPHNRTWMRYKYKKIWLPDSWPSRHCAITPFSLMNDH